MAYSESLAARTRDVLTTRHGIDEKKMFGGVGFLLFGNMLVGIWKDSLIVRLGPIDGAQALLEPDVREFDITGRPMKGWAVVEPAGVDDDQQLRRWIDRAWQFVQTLPPK